MSNSRAVDLTQGNIAHRVILFSLPILAGYLFQTFYNNVDSLVVGNYVGKEALAAVNACTPIYNLLVGFFIGMSTGASVIFSKALGAGEMDRLRDALHTTILFSLALGLVLGVAGVALVPFLLRLLNCQPDIFDLAADYLRWYIAGILFTALYNVEAAILRSVGDSRSPFYALVLSSLLNILLDLVFVRSFGMGVAGVAIATVLAQIISVALLFGRLRGMDPRYRVELQRLKMDWTLLGEILAMGLPAGLQSSLIAVSNIFVNRYINSFSSELMAGVGVAQKVDRFINMPCQALGMAATTFVSQNLGARKGERIRRGVLSCLGIGLVTLLAAGSLIFWQAENIMNLFNRDALVVQYGTEMIRTLTPLYVFCLVSLTCAGTLRGFGYSRQVTVLSLLGMVGVRQLFLAVFLALYRERWIIYFCYPVGWSCDALSMVLFGLYLYRKGKLTVPR